ncbi:hypothetical protein WH52_14080 [Tenacibaculum holothuriorum]|uniref:Lipocalin-like domain-containing protein n=1 Tax=Tenacibaculum holothuriorum TaxID=1635173 RepID=A0A1Y2PB05_9FLAO|nr:hypothetical protein [Tenacibaculum holothuriorum]OSY86908.1 hypothetical protein WH52_14080 [Tenacibaculum holothuriorum]
MKSIKLIIFVAFTSLLWNCSDDETPQQNAANCSTECSYTLASGENAGTVPSSLDGTYELTYHSAQNGSPFSNGTKATFTISNNVLTVKVEGKDCITLKNPVLLGTNNFKFKDNCRDNIGYNVSPNNNGTFNEINIEPLGQGWHGQFSK